MAAFIWRIFVDCMCDSFRLCPLAARHRERSRFWRRENIQLGTWGRRAEERIQIHHDFCGEFERAGNMVHGLLSIIHENERIRSQGFLAVFALACQTRHPCQSAMVVVHDEHVVSLLHLKRCQRTRSSPGRALVKDQCRKWLQRSQDGLSAWTPQRREVINEEVSTRHPPFSGRNCIQSVFQAHRPVLTPEAKPLTRLLVLSRQDHALQSYRWQETRILLLQLT